MLKIGLTGGIGSGKSAVANLFAALGVSVIDADVIARGLVETGSLAYDAIIDAFGVDVLRVDAELDRGKLRKIIFDDPEQRKKLEAILHPLVRLKIHDEISQAEGLYCLVVIPLMVETGQMDLIDQLIVVDVPTALQVKRTALRDGVASEDVEAIIRTQADRAQRRSVADFVIENSGSLDELMVTVKQLDAGFRRQKKTLVDEPLIEDNDHSNIPFNDTSVQLASDMPLANMSLSNTSQPAHETSAAEAVHHNLAQNSEKGSKNSLGQTDQNGAFAVNPSETFYELPFNEKVRTFVRLESLFNEIEFKLQGRSVWDSRSTIQSLMALLDVFSRPEIKTDLMKEMDRMNNVLSKYESVTGVNTRRLQDVRDELCQMAKSLRAFEGQIGQNLKLNELFMSIRQRDSLPGGALGIDVPAYAHWLAQSIDARNADILHWLQDFEIINRSVNLVLRLIRQTAVESDVVANNGIYQHVLDTGTMVQIVGVVLPKDRDYFPEISGGRHRYTVRFLKPMGATERPVQVDQDIPFKIICCAL